jgi:hypothetical protein
MSGRGGTTLQLALCAARASAHRRRVFGTVQLDREYVDKAVADSSALSRNVLMAGSL